MIIMSNMIETLLLRNLQEVFGEGDPERRRSAIEQLYTEDCVVNLPVGQYHGHDALDRICGELRASHPSYVYTPHNAPIVVQDGGRVDWGSGPAGEPPRYTGIDIIITRDDKISALYVFLNSPPIPLSGCHPGAPSLTLLRRGCSVRQASRSTRRLALRVQLRSSSRRGRL